MEIMKKNDSPVNCRIYVNFFSIILSADLDFFAKPIIFSDRDFLYRRNKQLK